MLWDRAFRPITLRNNSTACTTNSRRKENVENWYPELAFSHDLVYTRYMYIYRAASMPLFRCMLLVRSNRKKYKLPATAAVVFICGECVCCLHTKPFFLLNISTPSTAVKIKVRSSCFSCPCGEWEQIPSDAFVDWSRRNDSNAPLDVEKNRSEIRPRGGGAGVLTVWLEFQTIIWPKHTWKTNSKMVRALKITSQNFRSKIEKLDPETRISCRSS